MIKAPFNFVPLADKVYSPNWAEQISQDVPFGDGVSGYIDLVITAQSPIFIRNGHTKEEAEAGKEAIKEAIRANKENPDFTQAKGLNYNSFCKAPEGSYFIPSTSIKGEVRSILEIMTFSKMRVDKCMKFAQREWYNDNLYPKLKIQAGLLCGYLKYDEKRRIYTITPHGKPYRISHKMIDAFLRANGIGENIFECHFSKNCDFNLNRPVNENGITYDPKTARYKYHLVGKEQSLINIHFDMDDSITRYSNRLKYSPDGMIIGDIVLTGQPSKWVYPRPNKIKFEEENPNLQDIDREFMKEVQRAGKFFEFVFPTDPAGEPIDMDEIDFNYFKFIYSESEEWPRVKELLNNNSKGVPVFYRKEEKKDKNGNKISVIKDFGLAYMYKLPYDYSPNELLERMYNQSDGPLDMAECMFGTIGLQKEGIKPFRGRIQFTNFISHNAQENEPITLVLNSPKASYYPIYIKQEGKEGIVSLNTYQTYNDGELSGWKRYVVRTGIWSNKTGDPKMDTTLFPLKPGTEFSGSIHFHNLRPVELGALLSALTFHATDGCYHQLGQGKPYGLGKATYEVQLHCKERKEDKEYFMALFERTISKTIKGWRNTSTIKSLFTLAGKEVDTDSDNFKYMKLSVNPNVNEFQSAKTYKKAKNGETGHNPEYLQDFISLQRGIIISPNVIEPYNKEIEEKAVSILNSLEQKFETFKVSFEETIETGNLEEAKQKLQEAKKLIGNPAEPLLHCEVSSLIDELVKMQHQLSQKVEEQEFNHYQDIYKKALNNSSTNAVVNIEETIALFKSVQQEYMVKWIEELIERKRQIERGQSNISTYLETIMVSSIAALANHLKKRNDITPISTEDVPFIVQKLTTSWEGFKASVRKTWLDRKQWGKVENVLGTEITNAIYDGIKELPKK